MRGVSRTRRGSASVRGGRQPAPLATLRARCATFDALADLPLEIEGYELERLELTVGEFERLTTIIKLRGGGEEGLGEDVIYDAVDHIALQDAGPPRASPASAPSASSASCSTAIDIFPAEPPSARSPAATAAGPSSRRRSTWRCARRAPTSPRRSAASRGRSTSSPRCGSPAGAGRALLDRAAAAQARRLPDAALQARPDQRLERRADRRAGRDRRRRLARPQGLLQGHPGRRRAPTPSSTRS